MSDALILAVVAMVCIAISGPIVLSMHLGRRAAGRATRDGFELSTGPDESEPTADEPPRPSQAESRSARGR